MERKPIARYFFVTAGILAFIIFFTQRSVETGRSVNMAYALSAAVLIVILKIHLAQQFNRLFDRNRRTLKYIELTKFVNAYADQEAVKRMLAEEDFVDANDAQDAERTIKILMDCAERQHQKDLTFDRDTLVRRAIDIAVANKVGTGHILLQSREQVVKNAVRENHDEYLKLAEQHVWLRQLLSRHFQAA